MFTTTLHILETTFIHHGGILWDHLLARESFLFHFDGSPTGQHNPNCTQGHGKKRLWHACDKRPWRRWRSPAEQAFHIEGGTDRNPSRPFSDQRIEMLLERATCRLVGRPTRWCYLEIGDEQCAIWIQEMSNVLFGSRRWAMCYLDTGDEKCGYIQEMSNVLPGDRRWAMCYLDLGDEQCASWIQEMRNVDIYRRWAMCYLETGGVWISKFALCFLLTGSVQASTCQSLSSVVGLFCYIVTLLLAH